MSCMCYAPIRSFHLTLIERLATFIVVCAICSSIYIFHELNEIEDGLSLTQQTNFASHDLKYFPS